MPPFKNDEHGLCPYALKEFVSQAKLAFPVISLYMDFTGV